MQCGLQSRRVTVAARVYATWNPSDKDSNVSLSGGDLTAIGTIGSFRSVRATISKSSGKHYFEILNINPSTCVFGYFPGSAGLTIYPGDQDGQGFDGTRYYPTGQVGTTYTSITSGDRLMFAYDLDNGRAFIGKNGSWLNSGDPVGGTGSIFPSISGAIFPAIAVTTSRTATANFGASAFTYSPPSGYNAGWYT